MKHKIKFSIRSNSGLTLPLLEYFKKKYTPEDAPKNNRILKYEVLCLLLQMNKLVSASKMLK